MQESTDFSPAGLVLGHTVRGPLRLLRENFLSQSTSSNVLNYLSKFRERLHKACDAVSSALTASQGEMKRKFDRKCVKRDFEVNDKVLALLPSR